jgi:exodeoxyribonuclease VII large subunit
MSSMNSIDISHTQEIYTVSQLNREVRFILEGSFPLMWVEGEISNFSAPASGHWYFSLKDANAQVRCAMFKMSNRKLDFIPKDGMHVLLKARLGLYELRGEYQLTAEHMEEVGEGKLRQAFDALKKRLFGAGLFAESHKKPLPAMPKAIAVITSPTGAAIRDILSVLNRRFPSIPVIIYPTSVQGEAAASNIVRAIQIANERKECDVIILARGGGSLEDLWSFNEEIVAQAIYASDLPIISGVGHEVDFTIADFVADVRAPTPSAAAELITPHADELLQTLASAQQQLLRYILQQIRQTQQNLDWTSRHLQQLHPKRKLGEQRQQLDVALATLIRLQTHAILHQQENLKTLRAGLAGCTPTHQVHRLQHQLNMHNQHLKNALLLKMQELQQRLVSSAATLDALSPLATLQRGFAIVTKNQRVVSNAQNVQAGDKIAVRLSEGKLECTVDKIS